MAISISYQPNADYKHPAWNDLNFVCSVSGTGLTKDDLKVIASVKVNGTTVQTLDLYLFPNTTRAYCNVNKIVQNYITDVYQGVQASPSIYSNQTLTNVRVDFQEYYDGANQGLSVTTQAVDVWRASMSLGEIVEAEYEQYQLDPAKVIGTGTFNFLTPFENKVENTFGSTAPSAIPSGANILKIKAGQIAYLRFLCNSVSGLTAYIRFGLYDETKTRTFDTQISLLSILDTKMYDFAIGTDVLDTHAWDNPFTLDSDDKYFAILITSNIASQTKTYFFEIDWTPCNAYDNYEVHWLNRYGGFDSWVFSRRSTSEYQVEQEAFKVNPFDISSPAPTTTQRYVKPFYTQMVEVLELNSDNLSVWEYSGLKDVFTSPEIYVKIDNKFYSAMVQDYSTVRNYKQSDGVFNAKLKLSIDNSEQRQW